MEKYIKKLENVSSTTLETNDDDFKDLRDFFEKKRKEEIKLKNKWKRNLKGLINVSGLFKHLTESNMYWYPVEIVEIYETDEKNGGYSSYQNFRIKDDKENLLYMKQNEDEIRSIDHCCIFQTCGMMGDDYSGYLLYPLKDGRYFKVGYSC